MTTKLKASRKPLKSGNVTVLADGSVQLTRTKRVTGERLAQTWLTWWLRETVRELRISEERLQDILRECEAGPLLVISDDGQVLSDRRPKRWCGTCHPELMMKRSNHDKRQKA